MMTKKKKKKEEKLTQTILVFKGVEIASGCSYTHGSGGDVKEKT